MVNTFQNKLAWSHDYSQNYFMAEKGLTSKEDQQYMVSFDLNQDSEGGMVYIFDRSLPSSEQIIFTLECATTEGVKAIASALEQEVGYWDAYDYYMVPDVQRDAVESYEANNRGFLA